MNLWLRLIWLVFLARRRPRLELPGGVSRLAMRAWPQDIDTSAHVNNGRYWTLMDLGRADLLLRSGLWRAVLRNRWVPVLNGGHVRFRRELRPFRAFVLETRILCWHGTHVFIEHRLRTPDGTVAALAIVQAGLYDRRKRAFVPMSELMRLVGATGDSPPVPPEVAAIVEANTLLGRAARG